MEIELSITLIPAIILLVAGNYFFSAVLFVLGLIFIIMTYQFEEKKLWQTIHELGVAEIMQVTREQK